MTTNMHTIMWKDAAKAAWALPASSTLAPTSMAYPAPQFVDDRLKRLRHSAVTREVATYIDIALT